MTRKKPEVVVKPSTMATHVPAEAAPEPITPTVIVRAELTDGSSFEIGSEPTVTRPRAHELAEEVFHKGYLLLADEDYYPLTAIRRITVRRTS